jgi:hypothetical protein
VSSYDPKYPPQISNVSYGIGQAQNSTVLVGPGAAGRMRVPTNGSLGDTWVQPEFNDSSWTAATTGVGYDQSGGTPLPNEIEPNNSTAAANSAVENFQGAPGDVYHMVLTGSISSATDTDYFRIGQLDAGDVLTVYLSGAPSGRGTLADPKLEIKRGPQGGSSTVLIDSDSGDGTESLVYRMAITATDTYYIKPGSDNGATGTYQASVYLENTGSAPLTGSGFASETEPNNGSAQSNDVTSAWALASYRSHTAGTISSASDSDFYKFTFTAGDIVTARVDSTSTLDAKVSLLDSAGNALASDDGSAEGPPSPDNRDANVYAFHVTTTGTYYVKVSAASGTGAYNADVYLTTTATLPGGTSYTSLIGTDVGASMRNVNPSAYVRIPFDLTDPSAFDFLRLRMKYDDGFVAYLNGQPVASANAPEVPAYNSVATADHATADALVYQDFDLSDKRSLLRVGRNVLAIQGLNLTAGDKDFLVLPLLEAGKQVNQDGVQRYFTTPTPGGPNGSGAADLGPILSDLSKPPAAPTDDQDIAVSVRATPAFAAVASVSLFYRVNFGAEVQLSMLDDGQHGDGAAGDGVYGATIPASASTPGQMVRWYVTAGDAAGNGSRFPLYASPTDSEQYVGTMVVDASVNSALPVYYWFIQNSTAANGDAGSRASLYYDGELYDNIKVSLEGQSSRSWAKKSYKFDFHQDHLFRFARDEPRVEEFNLKSTFSDKTYLRQELAYDTYRDAGVPSLAAFQTRIQQNGQFFSVAFFVENGDQHWLKREGLDPDGALYKFNSDVGLRGTGGYEKLTRTDEPADDINALVAGISPSNPDRAAFLFDNVDVAEMASYLSAFALVHDNDSIQKNFFMYRDTNGDGLWRMLPWDKDLTFGRNYTGSGGVLNDTMWATHDPQSDPLAGDMEHPKIDGSGAWNALIDAMSKVPAAREIWMRRLRTVMDQQLNAPGTPYDQRFYETKIDQIVAKMAPDVALDRAKWGNPYGVNQDLNTAVDILKTQYLDPRRTHFYVTHNVNNGGVIPDAQPANPTINFGQIEYLPASNNQDEEFVELRNPNGYAVDISGWKLGGAVSFKFKPGTVIPAGGSLYVSPNIVAFKNRASGPHGGQGLFVVGGYKGHLSANGESLTLTDDAGRVVGTTNYAGSPSAAQKGLRITEIMYAPRAPQAGSPYTADDFEFIELRNIGTSSLNLNGVHFASGVVYSFGSTATLAAGAYGVLVKNLAAFQSRYGTGVPVLGTFTDTMDNFGESVELQDARNEKIVEVDYEDGWYPNTAGEGFSLVIRNDGAVYNTWGEKESWRPSKLIDGNPGAADNGLNPNSIVISEVMSSAETGGTNWIELHNQTAGAINVGGWFLSDATSNLRKFTIPANTTISANGYLSIAQDGAGGFGGAFTLSAALGGAVYLSGSDGAGNLAGYRDSVDFGAADVGVSFGRYIKSNEASDFVAMAKPTRDAANSGPRVGPVVVSEIMYHPQPGQDEFIELRNVSDAAVSLVGWRFTDGVSFTFGAGATIGVNESILVVPIDPALFRTLYSIPASVQIFGPYTGALDGKGETLELSKPLAPVGSVTPYVRVDKVSYGDDDPWPAAADGQAPSLGRVIVNQYGNDVANWRAERAGGTPGTPNTGAPYVLDASIRYGATPMVVVRFSEDVGASIDAGDLVVTNVETDQWVPTPSMTYDPLTFTATWELPTSLADGNYRLAIASSVLADGLGNLLDGNADGVAGGDLNAIDFHLTGDANHDRVVDTGDFMALYPNLGKAGNWSSGDFNFDGRVDFADYQILELAFGKTLAAPPSPAALPVAQPAPVPVPVAPKPVAKPRPAPAKAAKNVTAVSRPSSSSPVASPASVFSAKPIRKRNDLLA